MVQIERVLTPVLVQHWGPCCHRVPAMRAHASERLARVPAEWPFAVSLSPDRRYPYCPSGNVRVGLPRALNEIVWDVCLAPGLEPVTCSENDVFHVVMASSGVQGPRELVCYPRGLGSNPPTRWLGAHWVTSPRFDFFICDRTIIATDVLVFLKNNRERSPNPHGAHVVSEQNPAAAAATPSGKLWGRAEDGGAWGQPSVSSQP